MSVGNLLFKGVYQEDRQKRSNSLFHDTKRLLKRSRGIQEIFNIGICGFSWAALAPFSSEAQPFIEQGRCISQLCKSTFRLPELVIQGNRLWKKGEAVRSTSKSIVTEIAKDPLEIETLKKTATHTWSVVDWISSVTSWGCRMLSFAKTEWLEFISQNLPQRIAEVGVTAGVVSNSFRLRDTINRYSTAMSRPFSENPLVHQAQVSEREGAVREAMSSGLKLFSMILTALRVCALAPVLPIVSLYISTASLILSLSALSYQNQPLVEKKHVSLIA